MLSFMRMPPRGPVAAPAGPRRPAAFGSTDLALAPPRASSGGDAAGGRGARCRRRRPLGGATPRPWSALAMARIRRVVGALLPGGVIAYRLAAMSPGGVRGPPWSLQADATFADIAPGGRQVPWAAQIFRRSQGTMSTCYAKPQAWNSLLDQLAATA